MQPQGQFDTGVDVGRDDTALRRAEPGRSGVRSLAARVLTVALLATLAALAALHAPPLQAQTLTTLVSNTHLTSSGNSASFQAQSFETGAFTGGYTVSEVDVWVSKCLTAAEESESGSGRTTPATNRAIWWPPSTNPGVLDGRQSQHVHGAGRNDAGCEHDLLDNRERGNLIQQGDQFGLRHVIK